MKAMPDEAHQSHARQFEQAIETMITCRTILKFNSSLPDKDKNELLTDIDSSVEFLRERLVANASIEAHNVLPQLQQAGIFLPEPPPQDNVEISFSEDTHDRDDEKQEQCEEKLVALYRISHMYLDTRQDHGISEMINRFNDVMAFIDEIQLLVEQSYDLSSNHNHIENLLHRIRGFAADTYTLLMEFARAISNALKGSDIYIDTEKLASLQKGQNSSNRQKNIEFLQPILKTYDKQISMEKRKGSLDTRIADATAFLIFLSESLSGDIHKREEITGQIRTVAKLLNDLQHILDGYKTAISTVKESL